jgi:hypothetical protein
MGRLCYLTQFLQSRYKLYLALCVSWFKLYRVDLVAGAKAKSVTRNLPILSVLGVRSSFRNVRWIGVFESDYFTFSKTKIESDLLIKSPISIFEPLRAK